MRRYASGVSLDEDVAPSLVRKSFMGQQPHLFGDFVRAAFPTMYFHNRFRADDHPDFVTHIAQNFGTHSYQDASTCCLSSVYLAHLTKDAALLKASRQMYGLALREVVRALKTPEATSGDMMCTMMMLSVYEMYARTTKDAWVMHADGVERVMQIRGVKGYQSGFPRSCYIAFRGFLIATALYEGKPCFLDGEEWQSFAQKVQTEDSKKPGEWSAFVDISELAFMEMAKCPRYISEAKSLSETSSSSSSASSVPQVHIDALILNMNDTTTRLVRIASELRACISAHSQRQQGIVYRPGSFIGPVPRVFPETSPSLLLLGAESTIATLNQLVEKLTHLTLSRSRAARSAIVDLSDSQSPLTPDDGFTPESGYSAQTPSTGKSEPSPGEGGGARPKTFSLPFRVVSELGRGPSNTSDKNDPRAVIWLDRVASSMGMLGTEIVHSGDGDDGGDDVEVEVEEVDD